MRSILISSLVIAGVAASASAQNNIRILSNNEPYLVISTGKHTNGQNYSWPPTNPPEFQAAPGIIANSRDWKILPGDTDRRAEPRNVSGVTTLQRNSAATTAPNSTAYTHDTRLIATKARAGGGIEPDWTTYATPIVGVPQGTSPGASQTYRTTTTITPVAKTFNDACMTHLFVGGEMRDKDGNAGQGPSQCLVSSWQDGPTPYPMQGFEDPTNGQRDNTDPRFIRWANMLVEEPEARNHSDYGQRRIAPLNPELRGHSLGTYFSDMVSNAAGGKVGSDLFAGAPNAGGFAIPLNNIGPVFGFSFPFAGAIFEVNPGDPNLIMLHPFYILSLDANGNAQGNKITIPQLPAGAAGAYWGWEFAILNTSFQVSSTAAQWILLN